MLAEIALISIFLWSPRLTLFSKWDKVLPRASRCDNKDVLVWFTYMILDFHRLELLTNRVVGGNRKNGVRWRGRCEVATLPSSFFWKNSTSKNPPVIDLSRSYLTGNERTIPETSSEESRCNSPYSGKLRLQNTGTAYNTPTKKMKTSGPFVSRLDLLCWTCLSQLFVWRSDPSPFNWS